MFNKFQRDKHLSNIKELTRRKMITGYLKDDKFNSQIEISRTMASPARGRMADKMEHLRESTSLTPQPINEVEKLTHDLQEQEKHMIIQRNKRTEELANRSKMRMQSWLGRLDYNVNKLDCKS